MQPKFLPQADHYHYYDKDIFENHPNHCIHISTNEDDEVGMHSHEFWELSIVSRGNGYHYIGEMNMPMTEGDVFVIPPNTLHGYWSQTRFFTYSIVIKTDFFDKHYSELEKVEGFAKLFKLEPHLRKVYNKNLFLHLNDTRLEKVRNSITRIAYLNSQMRFTQSGYNTLDLICQISHYMNNETDSKMCENPNLYGVLKVLEYIHDNYGEKLTIEKLAEISKTSPVTFNRHFKRMMKQAPMQYLISYRVNVARKMLEEKLYSKTEIAQKCGFYDISHMEKYLKLNP